MIKNANDKAITGVEKHAARTATWLVTVNEGKPTLDETCYMMSSEERLNQPMNVIPFTGSKPTRKDISEYILTIALPTRYKVWHDSPETIYNMGADMWLRRGMKKLHAMGFMITQNNKEELQQEGRAAIWSALNRLCGVPYMKEIKEEHADYTAEHRAAWQQYQAAEKAEKAAKKQRDILNGSKKESKLRKDSKPKAEKVWYKGIDVKLDLGNGKQEYKGMTIDKLPPRFVFGYLAGRAANAMKKFIIDNHSVNYEISVDTLAGDEEHANNLIDDIMNRVQHIACVDDHSKPDALAMLQAARHMLTAHQFNIISKKLCNVPLANGAERKDLHRTRAKLSELKDSDWARLAKEYKEKPQTTEQKEKERRVLAAALRSIS